MAPAPTEESVHEHPEQEPGEGRQCRGRPRIGLRMPRRGQQTQPSMRQDADRGHDKGDAQSGRNQGRRVVALDAQDVEREESQDCCRDAAGSEPAGDAPVHRSFEPVRQSAASLGYRRVEEVGPDSGRRVHPEQQNENRRHKRAAAYSGQSDEHADNKAGYD